jgi:hypothetical protein
MDTFPDRKGADQQLHARFGQTQSFSPLISGVGLNADKAFFLKRFKGGRQCCPWRAVAPLVPSVVAPVC